MHIVDTALEKRHQQGRPVQVAIVGAGYMARGLALQIQSGVPGMRVAAIANRTLGAAVNAYVQAGVPQPLEVADPWQLDEAIACGKFAVTDNPDVVCAAAGVEAVIEATGDVEFGARVAVSAIRSRKHIVLMNAELDATVGPILKAQADAAGVVLTNTDGDEPGVAMNLFRFVKTAGFRPLLAGNIKGFIDRHRTPDTQRAFAEKHGQKAKMITSFADGTKLSMELAVLANATGMPVGRRGMFGPACGHVRDVIRHFTAERLLQSGGLVDYVLGAEPGTGAFVVGYSDHPVKQQYMNYFKMGDGPLYVFYTPFHLPHVQLPLTAARAVLFADATVAAKGAPVCDVAAFAKRNLEPGEVLDGIGGYTCFGVIDRYEACRSEDLLPMGVAEGCTVTRPLRKDEPISYADVELPANRLCDRLRAQQDLRFLPRARQSSSAGA